MAAAAAQRTVPGTPRVISPSPTPSEISTPGSEYSPPTTRSAARKSTRISSPPIPEHEAQDASNSSSDSDGRARSRSRSRDSAIRRRRMSGLTAVDGATADARSQKGTRKKPPPTAFVNGNANGHLSPATAAKDYWREISRSPSPLGLIPIHREWRSFIHRHEIPRKALHVSIGFLTLFLYASGSQSQNIPPVLMTFLIPITLVEVLRHHHPGFNRFYIRSLGAFMRESEAHEKYNGVIFYLLGAWIVLRFAPKDIGVMGVLLLSWCDTAASTVGRLYGRYTPRLRKGKSLAGSLAAAGVGIVTAVAFWGWIAPRYEALGIADNTGVNAFAFQGVLTLPLQVRELVGLSVQQATLSGKAALGVMSVWAGFVASASEAIDIWGLDDNVTMPVLCGVGLWGFLKVFGTA